MSFHDKRNVNHNKSDLNMISDLVTVFCSVGLFEVYGTADFDPGKQSKEPEILARSFC